MRSLGVGLWGRKTENGGKKIRKKRAEARFIDSKQGGSSPEALPYFAPNSLPARKAA
jgi:hypothetical protein